MTAEMLHEDSLEGSEIARIVQSGAAAPRVLRSVARFLQDGQKIGDRHSGLRNDGTADDLAALQAVWPEPCGQPSALTAPAKGRIAGNTDTHDCHATLSFSQRQRRLNPSSHRRWH
ncbi:hypothetical protein SAMN07250955_11768 [Arboricoccus pini]|uniref:Uncharacterized protein n=1 Tax=Arboricoccus pini TaxID=1963835 RepID=A0A212RZ62_9PROT|nr:hypothetical protein SAMN07250955_11768 [Arboricoccus pini]